MISIVIPTLNRPKEIIRILKKIQHSDNNSDLDLIIVDDSKEDISGAIEKINKIGIHYIHRGQKLGVSSARNLGAAEAKGEYLIFFDDDDDFTEDWMTDFLTATQENPDLVFCDMKRVESNGADRIEAVKLDENNNLIENIFIAGAWMIKKDLFDEVGGYDERLRYAENTELFFRLGKFPIVVKRIPKTNFIYYPSPDGGSKNLQNMIDSILIILDKHQDILNTHVKFLYNQILGVNYMRFRNYKEATQYLLKAFLLKPYKMDTIGRLLISLIPPLAMKLYPEKPLIKSR